jgi:type IV pilus assembly protein PilW
MSRIRGFSIVELMVAITLALIVTAGVLAVFAASRSAYQSTSGTAALADGGRFALDFIQNGVRSAGYLACNTSARNISMLNGAPTLAVNFSQPLGGYEANGTGPAGNYALAAAPVAPDPSAADWATGLDAALANQVVQNNDVLVVYSTLRNVQPVYVSTIQDGFDNFITNTQGALLANQLAVISDCAKSVVFQISSISGAGSNTRIKHQAGGTPGNNAAIFPVSFEQGSQVAPVDTTVFYIGKGADGDGALFAYDSNSSPTFVVNELVPDIEAMQVLYGVDSTGTQTVSQYVTADQVTGGNFNNVMSVKVAVLAASPLGSVPIPAVAPFYFLLGTKVTAPRDTRSRQVFEITIAVRNSES